MLLFVETGSTPTRGVSIKGQSFKGYFRAFGELYGEDKAAELRDAVDEEFRNALHFGALVSGGWYPAAWLRNLHHHGTKISGDYDACVKVVRRSTENDLDGIYSFVARFVTPEFAFRQATRVLNVYVRGPDVRTEARKGEGTVTVQHAPGFDARMWRAMIAGSQVVLEHSGACEVVCRTVSGGGNDDDHLTFRANWR